jgi:hypothetical protein
MPSTADIQRYIIGAWRMMTGKPDGLRLLDISADGFWNSFFAIVVALPALIVSWVADTNSVAPAMVPFATRLSVMLRLATVGIGAWIVPLIAFILVSRRVGLGDRVVHYVIANNWAQVVFAWIMLPPAILRMVYPPAQDFAAIITVSLFMVSMVLDWQLTNSAIGKGGGVATAVFVGMFVAVLVVEYLLHTALGLGSLGSGTG